MPAGDTPTPTAPATPATYDVLRMRRPAKRIGQGVAWCAVWCTPFVRVARSTVGVQFWGGHASATGTTQKPGSTPGPNTNAVGNKALPLVCGGFAVKAQ